MPKGKPAFRDAVMAALVALQKAGIEADLLKKWSLDRRLGMTPAVLMRRVIAPQAIRTMVPGLGNEVMSALKNSSLASVIAVEELTLRSTQLASSTFDFFSIFFASCLSSSLPVSCTSC